MTRADGWHVKEESEHIVDVELVCAEHVWKTADVRWDGCVHYYRYFNTPKDLRTAEDDEKDEPCYLHICSVADTIDDLLTLAQIADSRFPGEWSGEMSKIREVLKKHGR